jgi:nucleoside-diphosphate-sugar epimerase
MKNEIAIIGKSVLGKELYDYLLNNRMQVKIISRSDGISYERETFKKLLNETKVIIWASGSYKNKETIWQEHVKNVEELVNSLRKDQKLIFTSSISVYGKKLLKEAKETDEVKPDTMYAKAKARGEEIVFSHKNSVILRLGVLYSHKYKAYQAMFSLVEKGLAIYFGDGNNNVPFTYLNDVLPCYEKAIKVNFDKNELFNVAGKGCKQIEAIKTLAEILGKKTIYVKMPKFIGSFCDLFNCFLNSEAIESISSNRIINSDKAIKSLGFKETEIRKGIKVEVEKWKRMKGM